MNLFGFFASGMFFGIIANAYAFIYGADNYFLITLYIGIFFLLIGAIHALFYSIVEKNKLVVPIVWGLSALLILFSYIVWF